MMYRKMYRNVGKNKVKQYIIILILAISMIVEFLKANCNNIVRNDKDTFVVLFIRMKRQKSVLLKRQNRNHYYQICPIVSI